MADETYFEDFKVNLMPEDHPIFSNDFILTFPVRPPASESDTSQTPTEPQGAELVRQRINEVQALRDAGKTEEADALAEQYKTNVFDT